MRSLRSLAPLVLLAVLAAGCGDDGPVATDSPTADATPTQQPTPDPTPTEPAEPTEPAAPADVVPPDLDPALVATAQAWLRLARGEPGPGLPVEADVPVYFGGDEATTVAARDAQDPRAWSRLCDTAGEGYAMRECPLSALTYVEAPGVELTTDPAQAPCDRAPGLEPADVGATQRVTLLAPGQRSCLDYAAIELYVDDATRLVAVDLVIGSP